jgi:hypothetical protein
LRDYSDASEHLAVERLAPIPGRENQVMVKPISGSGTFAFVAGGTDG